MPVTSEKFQSAFYCCGTRAPSIFSKADGFDLEGRGRVRKSVTFVSVTQSFNTTTSMGRLTLNVLLSFAQFEREVIGERIRDKVAASRKKGIWMGGWAPIGYDVKNRKLIVNAGEAEIVRSIFDRFARYRSGLRLVQELEADGFRNKYGKQISKTALYKLLHNRTYLGEAVHKGTSYPGEHEAIVPQALWNRAHGVIAENSKKASGKYKSKSARTPKGSAVRIEWRVDDANAHQPEG